MPDQPSPDQGSPDPLQRALAEADRAGRREPDRDDIAADDAGGTAMTEALDAPPTDEGNPPDNDQG